MEINYEPGQAQFFASTIPVWRLMFLLFDNNAESAGIRWWLGYVLSWYGQYLTVGNSFYWREGHNVGAVPLFKMHNIWKVPTSKKLNVGTVPTFEIHNIGTVTTFNIHKMGSKVFMISSPSNLDCMTKITESCKTLFSSKIDNHRRWLYTKLL